ncbi:MAG: RNA 2',3'-cyclic phosphodiesterase [Actinomycetes bacterium]
MRLFVALAPPREVLDDADRALAPVRERWPDLRWVPSTRWHLTLAFYGEVPDAKVAGTAEMLVRRLAGHAPVELRLRGAGQFSRRALWLGLDGEVSGLRRLARAVTFERRPYRPHLTVARLRGGVDAAPAVESLSAYEGPPFVASTVHLVRSRLGPLPAYDDVAVFTLDHRP